MSEIIYHEPTLIDLDILTNKIMDTIFIRKTIRHFGLGCLVALLFLSHLAWGEELPVSADFKTILDSRSANLVVWQYAGNPNIFIFDFPNLTRQGRSFNRITQLSEQQLSEPYPRVLNNEELARHIEAGRRTLADFAFGHDVLISELAQFFNLAERDKIELNPEEIVVRDFLISQGLIKSAYRGIYQALKPGVVILSFPQTQEKRETEPRVTEGARYAILLHELSHGEFYSNTYYATYCRRFWNDSLSDSQREAFKKFLSNYNYSTSGEELLINEMQAYLMFTPDTASFSAKKLGVSEVELEAMRDAFRKGKPPTKLPLHRVL
ncbi:MAG: hypothetical protein PHQ05_08320 [Sterolibacterium sp.]|nr:hypothetical protein [Sterolibacterium sp.]